MAPDSNDDYNSHPPAGEPSATCRPERDRVVLLNPAFQLAFSTADGNILSLHHSQTGTEFVNPEEAAADGVLWRLEIASEDGNTVTVSNRDCTEFTHGTGYHRHHGNLRLWLQWSGLRLPSTNIEGRVTAHVTFPPHAPTALFEADIQLPHHLSVRSFTFPCLCAVRSPDLLADDALFLPISGGVLLTDPCSALRADPHRAWRALYPGPASMQFFGYSSGAAPTPATLWLAAADRQGAVKTMSASAMPRSPRLSLTITQHPVPNADGMWSSGYPCALGLVFGDWFEAARDYRAWASQQPWCARGRGSERRLPTLTGSYGIWTSHWGGPRQAASTANDLQRLLNVPIKLDWHCWHDCARGGLYPDYFPPRDGERAFATAKSQLAHAGVLTQLDLNGLAASPHSQAWQGDHAERYALLPSPPYASQTRPQPSPSQAVSMCPSTPYWREKLSALARQIVRTGADGLHIEGLTDHPPTLCHASDHDHGAPTPTQWTAGARAAIAAVRKAIGEDRHLALDGPSEPYLSLASAFFTQHPAAERHALPPEDSTLRWSPIPLFSTVYHDYTALIGPDLSLVNQRPHDPLWPEDVIADLRRPSSLMDRDYQSQFCLEVGRSAVWGHHPILANFSSDQSRDDSNRHKLAFLAALLRAQAWGIGALLPYSEFMGPLTIEAPLTDIPLLVNPAHSDSSSRRLTRRRVHPILGSAWSTPGANLALVLVNFDQQPHDFTARLRSNRLPLQLPLRLIGRTFSEDGDVPAASLRTSGTEIAGRLPGRCIVLISLR